MKTGPRVIAKRLDPGWNYCASLRDYDIYTKDNLYRVVEISDFKIDGYAIWYPAVLERFPQDLRDAVADSGRDE